MSTIPAEPAAGVKFCPTPCDPDCDAPCHEAHLVVWKRDHDPAACERRTGA